MKIRTAFAVGAVAMIVAALGLWRLSDHDPDRRKSESLDFDVAGQAVAGTLWLPAAEPLAAIVLVHGDGPQDRTSAGGYAPLINAFLDEGIAVASWDKPGIGQSDGNWLDQSMADRAAETRAALDRVRGRFDGIAIGALGFSQAGWVLPRLTRQDADFLVLVGAAVSWREQGEYYTRTRLRRDGLDGDAIDRQIKKKRVADDRAFGMDAQPGDAPDGMPLDRWRFIRANRDENAQGALARLDLPLLAIWGAHDLNVNAAADAQTYRDVLADRPTETRITVWPNATHGLLKSEAYNWQLPEEWSWIAKLRFVVEGRYAFAPGALDAITDWILVESDRIRS